MSFGYRTRIRQTQFIWDTMTEAEKQDILGWCQISDQVIKQRYPNADVDETVSKMSDQELASLHRQVIDIYRRKIARKKSTARYLRQERRTEQAEAIEEEIKQDEKQVAQQEESQ